jgi:hypothetical protein
MLIDSDFNSNTGFGGIDYKIQIGWDNVNKSWTKTVEKWGRYDIQHRVIQTIPNYTKF